MSDVRPAPDTDGSAPASDNDAEESTAKVWFNRFLLLLALVVLGLLAWQIAAAFFPRWWAQWLGNRIDGRLATGTMWGLAIGFACSFLPLLLLGQLRRRFLSWAARGVMVLFAVALALPNLLTLAVVRGSSNAAHAGERILDVDGPGFRTGSAIGAAVGIAGGLAAVVVGLWLTHRKREVQRLKSELKDRDDAARAAGDNRE